jgi:hypothetical protein
MDGDGARVWIAPVALLSQVFLVSLLFEQSDVTRMHERGSHPFVGIRQATNLLVDHRGIQPSDGDAVSASLSRPRLDPITDPGSGSVRARLPAAECVA